MKVNEGEKYKSKILLPFNKSDIEVSREYKLTSSDAPELKNASKELRSVLFSLLLIKIVSIPKYTHVLIICPIFLASCIYIIKSEDV